MKQVFQKLKKTKFSLQLNDGGKTITEQNSLKKFYPWIFYTTVVVSLWVFWKKVKNLVSTIIMYSQNLWEEIGNCMCKLDKLFKSIVTNTFIRFGESRESGQLVLDGRRMLFLHMLEDILGILKWVRADTAVCSWACTSVADIVVCCKNEYMLIMLYVTLKNRPKAVSCCGKNSPKFLILLF